MRLDEAHTNETDEQFCPRRCASPRSGRVSARHAVGRDVAYSDEFRTSMGPQLNRRVTGRNALNTCMPGLHTIL
ncbi:hypothetical protein EVAR_8787_1 [Eumeta japonica]|uniref:Uncharacterized protein n=1 Tax=Eumeta variegata TaxID=151549 RepID=A0A4C1TTV3_EUMVA|nr:hypothetical protein EVAR_8787_1 [Eumeta japonica]